eukprot:gb/GEZN01001086.1/.p1 GENE.gb/GEZN01001086.1/~~gb/GEZN01001086.1/.p1  ORF type:complete len:1067 (+),score=191.49 gb/GEZN01001086.1/:68-3268(+)
MKDCVLHAPLTVEGLQCIFVGTSAGLPLAVQTKAERLALRVPLGPALAALGHEVSDEKLERFKELKEPLSIVRYLANSSEHRKRLLGVEPIKQSLVDTLLDFVFATLNPALCNWALDASKHWAQAKAALEYCEQLAEHKNSLCKTPAKASAADLVLAAALFPFIPARIPEQQLPLPSLRKWTHSLLSSPVFEASVASLGLQGGPSPTVALQLGRAVLAVVPPVTKLDYLEGTVVSASSLSHPARASSSSVSSVWSVDAPPTSRVSEVPRLFAEIYKLLGGSSPHTQSSTAPFDTTSLPSPSASTCQYSSLPSEFPRCDRKRLEVKVRKGPKVPIPGQKNILITSALPYVNNVPHLGNLIGCVLSADVYSRFCRLRGDNVIYVCGTDEYGTATETKAMEEGVTPQEICDKYHAIHRDIYQWFNIKFDHFGRTTTPQQTKICQDIFNKCEANGWVQEATLQQPWCNTCHKFLADRYIHGTCPLCQYNDARGDQCDKCQKLLNPIELLASWCWVCKSPNPEIRDTTHLFLNLPGLEPHLRIFVDRASHEGFWSTNSNMITQTWLKTGLKPRCITRDLKWGTPVPKKGFTDKVFYVWFDAPIGYISITANYTNEWEKWWKNPDQVKLYQFMGKDNVPFHTVIFPCSLLGTGEKWTMLHHISTTEYLNYETGKFSKSRGSGVFGDSARDTGIPAYAWRYYLLSSRPETSDSQFVWDEFAAKTNSELLNNLGNFINRALSFCSTRFNGMVPIGDKLQDIDKQLLGKVWETLQDYLTAMDKVKIRHGLSLVLEISRLGNQYQQETKPWELLKKGEEGLLRCGTIIRIVTNLAFLLALVADPFMPSFSQAVASQCGQVLDEEASPLAGLTGPLDLVTFLPAGHKLGNPQPLVQAMTADQVAKFREQFKGTVEGTIDFPLEIKAARVLSASPHDKDDQLWVLQLDVKEEKTRQVVARLRSVYTAEALQGVTLALLCNLKATKFKGVASQGMVLTATSGRGKTEQRGVLLVDQATPAGRILLPQDSVLTAKPNFEVKKELAKLPFDVNENLEVTFSQRPFEVPIKADKVAKNAKVQ